MPTTPKGENITKFLTGLGLWLYFFLSSPALTQGIDDDLKPSSILSEDYLLIVDINLGKERLANSVFIYTPPEATLIPLQQLCDLLKFPIEVDPIAMVAKGWFIREEYDFNLKVNEARVRIKGKNLDIPEGALIRADGFDLYVDINLLSQWLPLNFELDSSRLRMTLSSTEALPFEQQLARETRRKKTILARQVKRTPTIPDKYQWLGSPIVDINMGQTIEQGNGKSQSSYSLQGSGDFLGLETRLSVNRESLDQASTKRLTFNKTTNHPDKDLGAGLKLLSVGDVYASSDPLIFSGGDGLGLDLQFGGINYNSDFGKTIVQGDGPPGWEVELYRNGALIEFQTVGSDGRYKFSDVSVEHGENVFDIRLFGPQGQERRYRQSTSVGMEMPSPGKSYGHINHVDLNKNVFGEQPNDIAQEKTYLQYQYGLVDWLAAGLTYAKHQGDFIQDDKDIHSQEYYGLSLIGAFPNLAIELNSVSQTNGAQASALSGQTSFANTSVTFQHKKYGNSFFSDRNSGLIKNENEFRFSGTTTPFNSKPLFYIFGIKNSSSFSGTNTNLLSSKFNFQLYSGVLTFENNYLRSNSSSSLLIGETRYSRGLYSLFSLRSSVQYTLKPEGQVTSASLTLLSRNQNNIRSQLGLALDFTGGHNSNISFSTSYLFDHMNLSLSTILNENGDKQLQINAEFSFGRSGPSRWSVDNYTRSQHGRSQIRLFQDRDVDGIYSSADTPIEGAKIIGNARWKHLESDANGIIYLDGLNTRNPSRLKVNEASLGDPYLKPNFSEVNVIAHAGGIQNIDIPVTLKMEVEGRISILKNGSERGLGGIPVYVKGVNGEHVAQAITEFDGFYIVQGLSGGEYTLSFDRKALNKFKINSYPETRFTANPEEGIVYIDPVIIDLDSP